MTDGDDTPVDLGPLLDDAVRPRHSPLYRAMRENYEGMSRAFSRHRPDWKKLVAGFIAKGLLDGHGNPPTLRAAQQTWYRVRADMEPAKRPKTRRRADAPWPTPVVDVPDSEVLTAQRSAVSPPSPVRTLDDDPPARRTFKGIGDIKAPSRPPSDSQE